MGLLGERLHQRDVAIGIVLAMSLGLGLLFLNFFTAYATQVTTLLFGNILGVDRATVWTLLSLAIVAVAALGDLPAAAIRQPAAGMAEAKGVSLRLIRCCSWPSSRWRWPSARRSSACCWSSR